MKAPLLGGPAAKRLGPGLRSQTGRAFCFALQPQDLQHNTKKLIYNPRLYTAFR